LVQKARVLDYNRLDMLVRDKHSSLLDSFISYKEIELTIEPHKLEYFLLVGLSSLGLGLWVSQEPILKGCT
jgi:hypothetical protein